MFMIYLRVDHKQLILYFVVLLLAVPQAIMYSNIEGFFRYFVVDTIGFFS